jgi:hypothetical protein
MSTAARAGVQVIAVALGPLGSAPPLMNNGRCAAGYRITALDVAGTGIALPQARIGIAGSRRVSFRKGAR